MASDTSPPIWDPVALASQLKAIAGHSQKITQNILSTQPSSGQIGIGDASTLGRAFTDLITKMMSDPSALVKAQIDLFNDSMRLWQQTGERLLLMRGADTEPTRDKRFKHPDWSENEMFNFIKESYLV